MCTFLQLLYAAMPFKVSFSSLELLSWFRKSVMSQFMAQMTRVNIPPLIVAPSDLVQASVDRLHLEMPVIFCAIILSPVHRAQISLKPMLSCYRSRETPKEARTH